jgi:hypothetical protein
MRLFQIDPQFKNMKVGQVDADGNLTTTPAKNTITIQDLMRHINSLTYDGRGATQFISFILLAQLQRPSIYLLRSSLISWSLLLCFMSLVLPGIMILD